MNITDEVRWLRVWCLQSEARQAAVLAVSDELESKYESRDRRSIADQIKALGGQRNRVNINAAAGAHRENTSTRGQTKCKGE